MGGISQSAWRLSQSAPMSGITDCGLTSWLSSALSFHSSSICWNPICASTFVMCSYTTPACVGLSLGFNDRFASRIFLKTYIWWWSSLKHLYFWGSTFFTVSTYGNNFMIFLIEQIQFSLSNSIVYQKYLHYCYLRKISFSFKKSSLIHTFLRFLSNVRKTYSRSLLRMS